jgi:hypothetical protein
MSAYYFGGLCDAGHIKRARKVSDGEKTDVLWAIAFRIRTSQLRVGRRSGEAGAEYEVIRVTSIPEIRRDTFVVHK